MKISDFRGDLTDISAEKEALIRCACVQGCIRTDCAATGLQQHLRDNGVCTASYNVAGRRQEKERIPL